MKAYVVVITENYNFGKDAFAKLHRGFMDKEKANEYVDRLNFLKVMYEEHPYLRTQKINIIGEYRGHWSGGDLAYHHAYFNAWDDDEERNYDKEFWCHCEVREIEIE